MVYLLAHNVAAIGFHAEQFVVTDANGDVASYPMFGLLYRAFTPITTMP